ncbi:MAG: hypothetical protein ACP5FR_03840, partial [Candidatus Micrarchaeia archaeon]
MASGGSGSGYSYEWFSSSTQPSSCPNDMTNVGSGPSPSYTAYPSSTTYYCAEATSAGDTAYSNIATVNVLQSSGSTCYISGSSCVSSCPSGTSPSPESCS